MPNKDKLMGFRATEDEKIKIELQATKENQSPSGFMRKIILDYIDKKNTEIT